MKCCVCVDEHVQCFIMFYYIQMDPIMLLPLSMEASEIFQGEPNKLKVGATKALFRAGKYEY